jgi:hypothetical protein
MKYLNDFSTVSPDSRRTELAGLLALGVIRVLTKRQSLPEEDADDSAENSPEGLEEI